MTLHYAQNVRNAGPSTTAQDAYGDMELEALDVAEWHLTASADTGTSHKFPGRLYIVQCEWCPDAFAAHTKREAMAMFREHEDSMAELGNRGPAATDGPGTMRQ